MLVLSKSFRLFIQSCDNKVAKYLELYLTRGLTWRTYKRLFTFEDVNYLTFRNDGTISFLPKGKEHKENEDATWKRDGRQNGKPSKIIQKIITPFGMKLFNEKDFENFTNCYKTEFNDEDLKFELLPNTEIGNIYLSEALVGDGSLNSSCMRATDGYKTKKEWFAIYENCKDLQILVLKKDNLIAGRALVWTIGDIILMDRVYTVKEHYFEMFFNYAKKNEFHRKQLQNYDSKQNFINTKGEYIYKVYKIETDTDFDYYPYIDTFTFGNDGYLTNEDGCNEYVYKETDGSRGSEFSYDNDDDHEGEVWDDINGCYMHEDDSIEVNRGRYQGSTTNEADIIIDIDGDVWWDNDTDIISVDGDYYPKSHENIAYDNLNEEYILSCDAINITQGTHKYERTVESETIKDVDGEIWSELDADNLIIKINNDWFNITDAIEIDGDWYLKDSDEIELIDGTYELKIEEHVN